MKIHEYGIKKKKLKMKIRSLKKFLLKKRKFPENLILY